MKNLTRHTKKPAIKAGFLVWINKEIALYSQIMVSRTLS